MEFEIKDLTLVKKTNKNIVGPVTLRSMRIVVENHGWREKIYKYNAVRTQCLDKDFKLLEWNKTKQWKI